VISMKDSTIVKIVSIIALCIIGSLCIIKNIDSVIISTISAIIGGVAGYEFGRRLD